MFTKRFIKFHQQSSTFNWKKLVAMTAAFSGTATFCLLGDDEKKFMLDKNHIRAKMGALQTNLIIPTNSSLAQLSHYSKIFGVGELTG